jgi:hypothetical protein
MSTATLDERLYENKPSSYMTIQLDWPPDVVNSLTEEARQEGLSLGDHLLQSILKQKAANGATLRNEEPNRHACEEAGSSIRELREGNILGPDLAISDLTEEGRRF